MAQDVWLYDLATHAVERITDWRGTDTQPMWIGDAVYYLSDHDDWKVNLWRYDLATRAAPASPTSRSSTASGPTPARTGWSSRTAASSTCSIPRSGRPAR